MLKPGPDVICRRMGDTAVLVDLSTNQVFELNRTGHRIWELLGAGVDRAGIARQLRQEFLVENDRVEQEVEALLTALREKRLIQDDDARGPV